MLGEEIRVRRKRIGLTQKALAGLINVKPTTMCQYENGTNEMSFSTLRSIAEVLQCSAVDLAYEELGMPSPHQAASFSNNLAIHSVPADRTEPRDFVDPLDAEIVRMLKYLDKIAKEKVIAYMRDQKIISGYYNAIGERRNIK